MPEYIDKSVVLDQISKQKLFYEEERKQSGDFLEEMNCVGAENGLTALEDVVSDIPTADVAPVVQGKWEWFGPCYDGNGKFWGTCSVCQTRQRLGDYYTHCPACGAKMILEDK